MAEGRNELMGRCNFSSNAAIDHAWNFRYIETKNYKAARVERIKGSVGFPNDPSLPLPLREFLSWWPPPNQVPKIWYRYLR